MKYPIPPSIAQSVKKPLPPVRILTDYATHTIAYGSVGSGKSHRLRKVMEYFYESGCKAIDFYDEGRLENCYVALPNPHIDKAMAHGYPTECFVPATHTLPRMMPAIFKPFRIDFSKLKLRDVFILLGFLNDIQKNVLEMAWDSTKKNASFMDFINEIQLILKEDKMKFNEKVLELCDDRSAIALLQRLDKLNRSNILCDHDDPLALDLDKIMRDQKTITCFSFAYLEDVNIRHLLWGYLFREIFTMRMDRVSRKDSQYPMLVLVHREIQNNAPARGKKSSMAYEGQTISLEFIKRIVQEPRDIKVRILADSQDLMKIDSDVRKGFTTNYIFQMDFAGLKALLQHMYLDPKTIINIQHLPVGVFAVKSKPQSNHPYNRFGINCPNWSYPTKSWCKSPDDLFFRDWKSLGLPMTKMRFTQPKSIIKVERIKPQPGEVTNLKQESLYDHYTKIILSVMKRKLGAGETVNIQSLANDPLIKEVELDYAQVNRVITDAVKKNRIRRTKSGNSWVLSLPDPKSSEPHPDSA